MQKKTRLDVAVFEGGYAPSREKAKAIWFYEEATVSGGVGQTFAALLEEKGGNVRFFHKAVPDTFVKQASVDSQLRKFGLDKASIVSEVNHAEENPA